MELVNQTPIVAALQVTEFDDETWPRLGAVTAKATYRFDRGVPELETEDPVAIFGTDEETELGLLPRDDLPRQDPAFEVIVLGSAHAPRGQQVTQTGVSVIVGGVQRDLAVFGDRTWTWGGSSGRDVVISEPQPFERMPLTWDRTFGGSCNVLVDVESPVTVAYPMNPNGRGFDPGPIVKGLAEHLKPPSGFPQYDATRYLPNLEYPHQRIQNWQDEPPPVCWATVPLNAPIHAMRCIEVPSDPNGQPSLLPSAMHRAHPDWVIDLPPANTYVALHGLSPDGAMAFNLPAIRVLADYVIGDRTSTVELTPQMLVILPDEKRFYLTFRFTFNYEFESEVERCWRVRMSDGWYQPGAAA